MYVLSNLVMSNPQSPYPLQALPHIGLAEQSSAGGWGNLAKAALLLCNAVAKKSTPEEVASVISERCVEALIDFMRRYIGDAGIRLKAGVMLQMVMSYDEKFVRVVMPEYQNVVTVQVEACGALLNIEGLSPPDAARQPRLEELKYDSVHKQFVGAIDQGCCRCGVRLRVRRRVHRPEDGGAPPEGCLQEGHHLCAAQG